MQWSDNVLERLLPLLGGYPSAAVGANAFTCNLSENPTQFLEGHSSLPTLHNCLNYATQHGEAPWNNSPKSNGKDGPKVEPQQILKAPSSNSKTQILSQKLPHNDIHQVKERCPIPKAQQRSLYNPHLVSESMKTPNANPQSQRKSPRRKKRRISRRASPWDLHFKYLSKHLSPLHFRHRDDTFYRDLWLFQSQGQNHQFRRDPQRKHVRGLRLAFIFAQRKELARKRHNDMVKWGIERKARSKMYKLAYLEFKFEKIGFLWRMGKLRAAYRDGWSAAKEWKKWKESRQFPGKRVRRRRKRYVVDRVQVVAERRIFEYPGV
jgi:hypothetical protein